jgi:hypothetical protein
LIWSVHQLYKERKKRELREANMLTKDKYKHTTNKQTSTQTNKQTNKHGTFLFLFFVQKHKKGKKTRNTQTYSFLFVFLPRYSTTTQQRQLYLNYILFVDKHEFPAQFH